MAINFTPALYFFCHKSRTQQLDGLLWDDDRNKTNFQLRNNIILSFSSHQQPTYKSTNKEIKSFKLQFMKESNGEEMVQWNFYERRRRHHWTEAWNNFCFSFPRETNCHCSLMTQPEAASASARICSSEFFFSRQCPSPRISCARRFIVRRFTNITNNLGHSPTWKLNRVSTGWMWVKHKMKS